MRAIGGIKHKEGAAHEGGSSSSSDRVGWVDERNKVTEHGQLDQKRHERGPALKQLDRRLTNTNCVSSTHGRSDVGWYQPVSAMQRAQPLVRIER